MSVWDSLFGSKQKYYNESGSQGNQFTDEFTDIDSIARLLENIQSKGTIKKGTSTSISQLDNLLRGIPQTISKFSKENAIADSEDGVQAIIQDVLNSELGGILGLQTQSGGFNDSSTRVASESLLAKGAAQGAKLRLDTISDYAEKQTGGVQLLNELIGLAQDSEVRTGEKVISDKKSNESQDVKTQKKVDSSVSSYEKGTARGRDSIFDDITSADGVSDGIGGLF